MRAWHGTIALLMLMVAGCASTPQASSEQDAQAKQFQATPDAATVYIYRPGRNFDDNVGDITSVLYVDRRLVGQTIAGVYFVLHLAPGQHMLSGIGSDQGTMALNVQAGGLYFVSMQVRDGNSSFTQVGVETGKREVSDCCTLFDNAKQGEPMFPSLRL